MYKVPFCESLVWLDQGLNPGFPVISEHINHYAIGLMNIVVQEISVWF